MIGFIRLSLLWSLCEASVFTFSNSPLALDVKSVIHDHQFGVQAPSTPHNFSVNAPALFMTVDTLCHDTGLDLTGSVAVIRGSDYVRSSKRSSKYAGCAEAKGARAVITSANILNPGWAAMSRNLKGPQEVSIPMLEITDTDLDKLLSTDPSGNWTVALVADTNEWRQTHQSVGWILFMRVFMSLFATFGVFRCVACLAGHVIRPPPPPLPDVPQHWVSTRHLVMAILTMEIIASSLILVQAVCGPIMSTPTLPAEFHYTFGTCAFAMSGVSTFTVIALFLRWGSVSTAVVGSTEKHEKGIVAVSVGIVSVTVLSGLFGATYVFSYEMYLLGASGSLSIVSITAFVVYCYSGVRFLKRIRENKSSSTSKWAVERRERSLRKFLAWIKMSTVANFLLFAPTMIYSVYQPISGVPAVGAVAMFLLFCGAVLQSVSQSYGLQPDVYADEERRGEAEAGRQKYEHHLKSKTRLAAIFLPEQRLINQRWKRPSKSQARSGNPVAHVRYPLYSNSEEMGETEEQAVGAEYVV